MTYDDCLVFFVKQFISPFQDMPNYLDGQSRPKVVKTNIKIINTTKILNHTILML